MTHIPGFVNEYDNIDRVLFEQAKKVIEMAMAPGALDAKTKVLIVLALDTLKGASEGVKVLAAQARELGATDQELEETIRLAYFVAGMDPLKTGLNAFQQRPRLDE